MGQNVTDYTTSSEAVCHHDRLVRAAPTSRPVVILEKLEFDASLASYISAKDNEQIIPLFIKQEPEDIMPTLLGRYTLNTTVSLCIV